MAAWPIIGYVGANGAGKTLSMVEDLAVPNLNSTHVCTHGVPRTIIANFRIAADNYVPLRSWVQLVEAHNAIILLDEISAALPSRQAMSMPPQLLRIINQLRKAECVLGWSAPDWDRADKALREVTQAVALCRGSVYDGLKRVPGTYRFPRRGPAVRHVDPETGKADGVVGMGGWGANCLFKVRYFDAREMDEFSLAKVNGAQATIKAKSGRWYWRPAHRAHLVYDTMEGVDLLDHLDDSGACISCGGQRARRKCTCELEGPSKVEVHRRESAGDLAVAGVGGAERRRDTSAA